MSENTSPLFLHAAEWQRGVLGEWVRWRGWGGVKEQRCRATAVHKAFILSNGVVSGVALWSAETCLRFSYA
ncbi:MAG: hypothetical protein JNN07_29105 [Verrucomicrobiales bacterium]|nr:hypothetical protein [Verrucomicrobiales bacterium]